MYCPACGRENPYGTATCGFCGTALEPGPVPPPPPSYAPSPSAPPPGWSPLGPPPVHSGPGRLWLFFTLGVVTAAVITAVIVLVAKVVGEDADATAAPTTTAAPSTTVMTTTTAPPTTTSTAPDTTTTAAPSGMAWSRSPAGEDVLGVFASRAAIAAGGPGVVAVGWDWSEGDSDGAVWTSGDGLSWSRLPHDEAVFGGPGDQIPNGVTAGPLGLVAVGTDWSGGDSDAAAWFSVDGASWARAPHDEGVFGGPGDQMMLAVTTGGPGWVSVGFDGAGADRSAAAWVSADGLTWSRVPHDEVALGGPGDQIMVAVTAAGPGLVAVGVEEQPTFRAAAVWVSSDGLVWERVPHDAAAFGGGSVNAWMSSVAVGGPGLVAVGGYAVDSSDPDSATAAVWTSADGFTWSRVPDDPAVLGGPGYQTMSGVAANASVVVACGGEETATERRAVVWFSRDGLTWARVPHDAALFGSPDGEGMVAVAPGGPGFVALGARSVWVGTFPG